MRRIVSRALLAALVAIIAPWSASAEAQGVQPNAPEINGRALVLVPPLNGPQGPRVANVLRELITESAKYAALDDRAVRTVMAQYSVTALDSVTARQLAQLPALGRAAFVSWGTVTQEGRTFSAVITFTNTATGDAAKVTANGANPNEVAAGIFSGFTETMSAMDLAAECIRQVTASQFQPALATCDQALAVVPTSGAALFGRAKALYGLERWADALAAYNHLLEVDPSHQDAILGAGLSASRLNQATQAMTFYGRHIELNGNTTDARRIVAAEVIKTNDLVSAYKVLEPAANENRSDIDFQKSFFGVAFAAGTGAKTAARTAADSTAADRILEGALTTYAAAFPGGMVQDVENLLRAISVAASLRKTADALRMAQDGTVRFPMEARVWSIYAALLHDDSKPVESLAALNRLIELDPSGASYMRRGQAYLEALNMDGAIADFRQAAQKGEGDRVAQQLTNTAIPYMQPITANFVEAEKLLTPALEFASSAELKSNISYYLGSSIYSQADVILRQTNPTPTVPQYREALALIQKALPHLEASTHPNAVAMVAPLRGAVESLTNGLRGR